MIRLVVSSAEEAVWREVAARLRGAPVVTSGDSRPHEPSEACDAAAFVGPVPPEPGAIERLLRARKHVLLAAEACPSSAVLEPLFTAALQANVRLTVVNPDRYLPSRQLIRQHLD